MDSTAVEQAGATPIKATLAAIDAVNSRGTLLDEIARLQVNGVNVAFSYGADVDAHDAAHYLGAFDRGGLGLPDRDYYTKTDPSSDSLRKAYVEHITKMLTLVGDDAATARANAGKILRLETELAKASARAGRAPRSVGHRPSDDARQVSASSRRTSTGRSIFATSASRDRSRR